MATKFNLPQTGVMIGKFLRYQELFVLIDKTTGENTEMNQLQQDLIDYMITPNDFNNKVDIEVLNSHEDTSATTDTRGHVELEDTVESMSVAKAATANSVKTAYDEALKKIDKSGGTFTGVAKAQSNTSYTTAQIRNVILSTGSPTGGSNGDIWIKYR